MVCNLNSIDLKKKLKKEKKNGKIDEKRESEKVENEKVQVFILIKFLESF